MTSEITESLEKNLYQQLDCYKRLMKLEEEKQQALIENAIGQIESVTAQEEKILLEVGRLEEERLYWAEFFAKEIGKKAEEINLSDLAEKFPKLETVGRELENQINYLKNVHEINTQLLKNAMNLVEFTLQLLTKEKQTTYSYPGNNDGRPKGGKKHLIDKSG